MKRGALFGKKFLRNAIIVLAIVAVAYAVMYGVKEGFQAGGNTKEYPFNTLILAGNPLHIPATDLTGKVIKNISVLIYDKAINKKTNRYTAISTNKFDMGPTSILIETPPGKDGVKYFRQAGYKKKLLSNDRIIGDKTKGIIAANDLEAGLNVKGLSTASLGILNSEASGEDMSMILGNYTRNKRVNEIDAECRKSMPSDPCRMMTREAGIQGKVIVTFE